MNVEQALALVATADGDALGRALAVLVRDGDVAHLEPMRRRLAALEPQAWSKERFEVMIRIQLALFASRDRRAICDAILGELPYTDKGGDIAGVVLRDGALAMPFEDNSWGIPATPTLRDAIARCWGPLREHAPIGVARLADELLGLALLRHGNEQRLAYLALWRRDRYEVGDEVYDRPAPSRDRPDLVDWCGRAVIQVVVGAPPRAPGAQAKIALPLGLEALFGLHHRLNDGMWSISDQLVSLEELCSVDDEDKRETFSDNNDGAAPEDLYAFHSYGDDASDVLDTDALDDDERPEVRRFYGENWELGEPRPFGEWLEERIVRGFLHDPEV